jgi:3-methyladenine DNA glycosylase AlkD
MDRELENLKKDLERLGNPEKAKALSRFFKTGPGEYGEGSVFLGIMVPEQRKVAKRYSGMDLPEIRELLTSRIHEQRLVSVFILVSKYQKATPEGKKDIYDFYLKNTKNFNNWDLVDMSAPKILGNFLLDKDRGILYKLARSDNLWEKRISILSTSAFIDKNQFEDSLKISEILLGDSHDLIHKAVGWMLREIGKKDQETEEGFLRKFSKEMPRTMLRYAIERFDEKKRLAYMAR